MDKLTAYRILRIAPNSPLDEIKNAYARRAKECHPEEHPEEFQQLHEAYRTLIREHRQENRPQTVSNVEQEICEPLQTISKTNESPIQEFDFDKILAEAEEERQHKWEQSVQYVVDEIQAIIRMSKKKSKEQVRDVLERAEYQSIVWHLDFIEKLGNLFADSEACNAVCDSVIEFYHLEEKKNEKPQSVENLYKVLQEKKAQNEQRTVQFWSGVTAITVITLCGSIGVQHSVQEIWGPLMLLVQLLLFPVLYYKCHQKYSMITSQVIMVGCFAVLTFFLTAFDGYNTLFGTVENGTDIAAASLLGAIVWLFIVVVIALWKAAINRVKKLLGMPQKADGPKSKLSKLLYKLEGTIILLFAIMFVVMGVANPGDEDMSIWIAWGIVFEMLASIFLIEGRKDCANTKS